MASGDSQSGWTTASLDTISADQVASPENPTPGFVLVYSRLHESLPTYLAFASERVTIGREPGNTLTIHEAAISRLHARVERRSDGWWIVDNSSTNGVIVFGQRVDAHKLAPHDVVRIGDTTFRYAPRGIYAYGAYRIDGTVVSGAWRPEHHITDPLLVGGYQCDALLAAVEKIAPTPISVVVRGESGTGKELVAREVHRQSGRRGAFQAINCAALPAQLIESELFGYRRGAFTGANADKTGLVRAAHGGTLFLDEIGDMPIEAQAKLLRVLQEREVTPLGATQAERIDVRVVCATHRDLDALVVEGRFRGDLLARLREFTATLPPLRERREDVYRLVRHFLARAGRPEVRVSFQFMLAVAHYGWPYNVRELESAVKVALAVADGPELDLMHLPEQVRHSVDTHARRVASAPPTGAPDTARLAAGNPGDSSTSTRGPSEAALRALLAEHKGNIAAVGRELGKERMQVHRYLKRYGIDIDDYRD
jgi:DNA-binding NtrC family response regulator